MAKRKVLPIEPEKKETPEEKALRQEALEVTWVLKGDLKNAQIAYLRAAKRLAQVRDRKLYAALKHVDIESYADHDLGLSPRSLRRYLQAYDWVKAKHPEWLEPHPKGTIPDLADVIDLMTIEKELERKGLDSKKRDALKKLQTKALDGNLREDDLKALRRRSAAQAGDNRVLYRRLCALRAYAARQKDLPEGLLVWFDTGIAMLKNQKIEQAAGLDRLGTLHRLFET